MSILADKQVIVYDRGGLFPHVAVRLAEYCKDKPLWYFTEWREAFSRSSKRMPGVGLPNIARIDDFHEAWPDADLIVFTDIGDGPLQLRLREQGKLVWGSGLGSQIEEDKIGFNLWLAGSALPSPNMWLIEGMDALEEFLKDPTNDGVWLKANDRGELETHKHENWLKSEQWFKHLDYIIGPNRHLIKIIAQASIDSTNEIGYDGYMVDGIIPLNGIYGWESKDSLYLGKFTNKFPQSLSLVNVEVGLKCMDLGYRGLYSTEVREASNGDFYFIDPTMRAGSPPSAAMMRWYDNWDDIMYMGAGGRLVEPEPRSGYVWGAEVILKADTGPSDFLPVEIPDKIRQFVAIHPWCRINDIDYVCPKEILEFGDAVGFGRTPREAGEMALEVAEQVKAEGIYFDKAALEPLLETITEFEEGNA